MQPGIAMSYSAGACLHAFALFTCDSRGLSFVFYSANPSTIGVITTTGRTGTLQNGIRGHPNTMGISTCRAYSQSLLLAV